MLTRTECGTLCMPARGHVNLRSAATTTVQWLVNLTMCQRSQAWPSSHVVSRSFSCRCVCMLSQRLGVKDSAGDCLCIDELVNRLGLERFVNVSPSCLSQLSLYLHIFRQELRSAKENFQHTVKERWKNSSDLVTAWTAQLLQISDVQKSR